MRNRATERTNEPRQPFDCTSQSQAKSMFYRSTTSKPAQIPHNFVSLFLPHGPPVSGPHEIHTDGLGAEPVLFAITNEQAHMRWVHFLVVLSEFDCRLNQ